MRALIVGALLALGGSAHAGTIAWHDSLSSALAASRVSGKPVLALFVGEGCGPCTEIQTITMTDPQVVAAVAGFEAAVINTLTERVVATHFLVASVPTVKFLHSDGTVVFDNVGFASPEQFLGILARGQEAHAVLLRARKAAAETGEEVTPEAALTIARDFAFAWQHAEAIEWADRALQAASQDAIALQAEALLIRGRALIAMGEPRLAAAALTEYLRLAADGPDAWAVRLDLGNARLQSGETESGVALLRAVYEAPEAGDEVRAEAKRLLFWVGEDAE